MGMGGSQTLMFRQSFEKYRYEYPFFNRVGDPPSPVKDPHLSKWAIDSRTMNQIFQFTKKTPKITSLSFGKLMS
jgi:hypothetical protein